MKMTVRSYVFAAAAMCVLALPAAAQNAEAVATAKADLQRASVPLAGACGAAKITNLVAWRARPVYGLLFKAGGNRAVLKPDGSCLDGDSSSEGGYATDYLIVRGSWVGFDLLGDGGGANNPQWSGPEDAPDMVARNQANFREPIDPSGYLGGSPPPPPPPAADLEAAVRELRAALVATITKVGQLEAALVQTRDTVGALDSRVHALEQDHGDDTGDLAKRVIALEARPIFTSCSAYINLGFVKAPIAGCRLTP